MFDQSLADLAAELEWRRARKLTNEAEQAANEVRIAALDRRIAKMRSQWAELRPEPARGSPIALIVVLMSYTILGLLASL